MALEPHDFADLLTSHQRQLYRYIVSLLGDTEAAWDVLQETNRVLLEKKERFERGTSFINWALTTAQFQTMAWLRDRKRDRMIASPEIVELLAADARQLDLEGDSRQSALRECLRELSPSHRELLRRRYAHSHSLAQLAETSGRSVGALKQLFFRIRGLLMQCIALRLEAE